MKTDREGRVLAEVTSIEDEHELGAIGVVIGSLEQVRDASGEVPKVAWALCAQCCES